MILIGSCNYERMGSDTLNRTNFLKQPRVHPILSLTRYNIKLYGESKGAARLQGRAVPVGSQQYQSAVSSTSRQSTVPVSSHRKFSDCKTARPSDPQTHILSGIRSDSRHTASATIPSPRPVNPIFSVVVAFTETESGEIFAMAAIVVRIALI